MKGRRENKRRLWFDKPDFERPHKIVEELKDKEGYKVYGVQKIWRFSNGFGASVVRYDWRKDATTGRPSIRVGSYGAEEGRWELAIIRFTGNDLTEFKITYDTHLADDVKGWLTEKDVVKLLREIRDLDPVVEAL